MNDEMTLTYAFIIAFNTSIRLVGLIMLEMCGVIVVLMFKAGKGGSCRCLVRKEFWSFYW